MARILIQIECCWFFSIWNWIDKLGSPDANFCFSRGQFWYASFWISFNVTSLIVRIWKWTQLSFDPLKLFVYRPVREPYSNGWQNGRTGPTQLDWIDPFEPINSYISPSQPGQITRRGQTRSDLIQSGQPELYWIGFNLTQIWTSPQMTSTEGAVCPQSGT